MKSFTKRFLYPIFMTLISTTLLCTQSALALSQAPPANIAPTSQQLLWVTTKDENTHTGFLQRYERDTSKQKWRSVGQPIPVVTGKNGLAQIKKEGDGRTPIGVFKIGPLFGFSTTPDKKWTLPYSPLVKDTVCVDDIHSKYYNQIIHTDTIAKQEWSSGEQMRDVPQYEMGAVIQYNTTPIKPSAGSCIFMHIWKNSETGTAGCIAMDKGDLKSVLQWLNVKKEPEIAIYTNPLS